MSDSEKEEERETAEVGSIPPLLPDDAVSVDSKSAGSTSRLYKYHNYGTVEDTEELQQQMGPVVTTSTSGRGSGESSIRVQKFPVKLYAILAQKEFHDIITWMPHGRSWKVLKPSLFESLVMPLFFEYSNYHSFNRLVNAWSFRRVSSGPDRGSYYHELFLRGKPHLQKYMRRLPKTHKKLPMKKGDEPDFYKMDKESPLPALHEAPIPGAAATTQALRRQTQQQLGHAHPALGHGMAERNVITPPRQMLSGVGDAHGSAMGMGGMPGRAMGPSYGTPSAGMGYGDVGYDEYDGMPPGVRAMAGLGGANVGGSSYGAGRTPMSQQMLAGHGGSGMMHGGSMMRDPITPGMEAQQSQFMDQAEYFHFQQQQQMQHMQRLHEMRMYEQQLANQEEYAMPVPMRPNLSPARY